MQLGTSRWVESTEDVPKFATYFAQGNSYAERVEKNKAGCCLFVATCMCMCRHVCACVCVYVCARLCMHLERFTSAYVYIYVYPHMYVYIKIYIYIYMFMCVYICINLWLCMCMCVRKCVFILMYVSLSLFVYVCVFGCIYVCVCVIVCVFVCVCICVCVCVCRFLWNLMDVESFHAIVEFLANLASSKRTIEISATQLLAPRRCGPITPRRNYMHTTHAPSLTSLISAYQYASSPSHSFP